MVYLVMADNTSGWADLGNQARVIHTLDRNKKQPDWLREMRRSDVAAQLNVQVNVSHETARDVMRNTATV